MLSTNPVYFMQVADNAGRNNRFSVADSVEFEDYWEVATNL